MGGARAGPEIFCFDPGVQLERALALLANLGDVAVEDISGYVSRSIEKDQRRLDAYREAALADQKRILRPARRQIAELVEDDEVEASGIIGDVFLRPARLGLEPNDEIDGREEPPARSRPDAAFARPITEL